jgi:hypothetical protein
VLTVGCTPTISTEHEFITIVEGLSDYFGGTSDIIGAALKYKRSNLIALSKPFLD